MGYGNLGHDCKGSCMIARVFIVLPVHWNSMFCHHVPVASNMHGTACHKILIEFKPCVCG